MTVMHRLILSVGMAIFVAATLMLINTPSSAYGCNNSTNTNHTNFSSGANGSPGNLSRTSTSTDSASHISGIAVAVNSPGVLSGNVIQVPVHVPCK